MSADLFAEFSQPSKPSQQQPQQQQTSPFQALGDGSEQNKGPFDFGFGSGANPKPVQSAPAQQWPAFQPQHPTASSFSSTPVTTSQPGQPAAADDEDGWGDFEVAEPAAPQASFPIQPSEPSWQSSASPAASQGMGPVQGLGSPAFDIMSNSSYGASRHQFQDSKDVSWPQQERKQPSKLRVQPKAADPNVLFDAGDFELEDGEFEGEEDDEDDFGDFETVKSPSAPKPAPVQQPKPKPASAPVHSQPPSMDLLSLDDTPQPAQSHQTPESVSQSRPQVQSRPSGALSFGASRPAKAPTNTSTIDDSDDLFNFGQTTAPTKPKTYSPTKKPLSHTKISSTVTSKANPWGAESLDDDWAAWDDAPSNTVSNTEIEKDPPPSSWDWGAEETPQPVPFNDSDPPPINVPPPSVILATFPELLSSGNALFKSTSGQSGSVKEQILSNPKAVRFLQGYILLATTAARVIAGRKHRWHRDKILAKSMSISAAGSKGMKLAGVDKTQAAREDREAADVVAVWKEHIGRLRSAVAVANTAGKARLKVPELSESLPVHTAKNAPTAPKPCVVCGLKRDERITKVDFDVEDSFGEWWAEHWGHRACKNFWVEHEQRLRQR